MERISKLVRKFRFLILLIKFYHLTEELDAYYDLECALTTKRKRLVLNYMAYVNVTGNNNKYDVITYSMYKVHSLWGVDKILKKEIDMFFHI